MFDGTDSHSYKVKIMFLNQRMLGFFNSEIFKKGDGAYSHYSQQIFLKLLYFNRNLVLCLVQKRFLNFDLINSRSNNFSTTEI